MKLSLAQIARAAGASGEVPSGEVSGYSIDSRTLAAGDLFIALRGDQHDGHEYVRDVLERGAAAAMVDRDVPGAGRLLRVGDTLAALQRLAAAAREQWAGTVVGVTGSAGKTTTKDVIAAMLSVARRTGKTAGNYNNHIGLPLSILRLPDDAEVAVLELGMNRAGEIRALAKIARPAIAVVTNVGYAHIEAFDSIDGIALAKRELVESLPAHGTAILNADDEKVREFARIHPGPALTFGLSPGAQVRAEGVELTETGTRFSVQGVQFDTPLLGRFGVRNVLAGLAVAQTFGIPLEELRGVVRSLEPGKMRGERIDIKGYKILNDCYNSNPDAARGMLDVLRDIPATRHIAVLGEMLELGRWAEPLHRDIGSYAVRCGISVLVGIRGAARHMVDGAMEAGQPPDAAYFFPDPEEAGARLKSIAREGDAILFKGSRGSRVEKALEKFLE